MFKQQPSKDQLMNRVLYQLGKLDYLPVKEPIDNIIISCVEAKEELKKYQQYKEQIIKDIEKEAIDRIEEELDSLLKDF